MSKIHAALSENNTNLIEWNGEEEEEEEAPDPVDDDDDDIDWGIEEDQYEGVGSCLTPMLPPTEPVKIEPVRQEKAVEPWRQAVSAVQEAMLSVYRGEKVDFCGIARNAILKIRETFYPLSDNLERILWDLEGYIERFETSTGNLLDGANEVFNELSRIVQIIESGGAQDLNKNDTNVAKAEKKLAKKTKNVSTPIPSSFVNRIEQQTENLSHQLDTLRERQQTLSREGNGGQGFNDFRAQLDSFVRRVRDEFHPENGSGFSASLDYLSRLLLNFSRLSEKDKNKKIEMVGEVLKGIELHIESDRTSKNRCPLVGRIQHVEPLNPSGSQSMQVRSVLNEMTAIHENVARGYKTVFAMEQDRQKLIALCSQLTDTIGATSHLSRTIQNQTLSHLKGFSSYVKNGGQMGDGIYMKKWKDLEQDLSMLSKTDD